MKMKKRIALALALLMLLSSAAALAERSIVVVENPQSLVDTLGVQADTQLTVGMTTKATGLFATNMWGTNAADLSVRGLLHGYATVSYLHEIISDTDGLTPLREGMMIIDGTAVAGVRSEGNGVDRRKYTFSLMTDLTYNDGTPITAKDYLFSLLMTSSGYIRELGGAPREVSQFLGGAAYQAGVVKTLAGARLIDDDTFSLEIDPSFLPYFYGIAMLDITPYPMSVIAPGCDIVDDGDGAYISGEFTKALLEKTLLDPAEGYLYNPRVTCGPYQFESFDPGTGTVELRINPEYLGNYEGAKPHVERVTLRKVDNETVIEQLRSGEIDIVSELVSGATISDGLLLRAEGDIGLQMQAYPRNGLAYLALACEKGVTQDAAVRKALAQCVDKQSIIEAVSPYSLPVHGYYGLGQWMPNYTSEDLDETGEPKLNMSAELNQLEIPFDVEAAKKTLEAAGWTLGDDGVRSKGGERLTLRWAKTQNESADQIRAIIEPALTEAGFALSVTEMPFGQVLEYYYRQQDRADFDLFFLASDFLQNFDPYYEYQADAAYQGVQNTSGLGDADLTALADAMRRTNSTQQGEYARRWLDYQKAWVQKLPLIPLYSNVYYDFFQASVQDYDAMRSLNWGYAMPYVWIGEKIDVPEEPEEIAEVEASDEGDASDDEDDDGGEIIIIEG